MLRSNRSFRLLPLAVAGLLAIVAPLIGLGAGRPSAVRAATHVVTITDGAFSPATLTIAAGDTVTWRNDDDRPHTVTAGDGSFDSGNLDAGQTFTMTFASARSVGYVCAYHDDMTATLTVGAAAAPSTVAPPAAPVNAPVTSTAPAPSGHGGTAAGGHDAAGGTAAQPDTALALPVLEGTPAWLPLLLIGLGLVAFAVAVVPGLGRSRRPVPAVDDTGARGGWRR
jgi:plastocyanin